jgi:hypothetical protein
MDQKISEYLFKIFTARCGEIPLRTMVEMLWKEDYAGLDYFLKILDQGGKP